MEQERDDDDNADRLFEQLHVEVLHAIDGRAEGIGEAQHWKRDERDLSQLLTIGSRSSESTQDDNCQPSCVNRPQGVVAAEEDRV